MKIKASQSERRAGLSKFDILAIVLLALGGAVSLLAGAMGGTPLIGVAVFVFLILVCVFYASNALERQRRIDDLPRIRASQRKRAEQVVRGLANHFKTTAGQNRAGLPALSMVSGGQPVEISAAANNLMISMVWPGGPFRLYVYPHEQMQGHRFNKAVDTKVHDGKFDKRFLIQTNEPEQAKQMLTPSLKTEIQQLADLVEPAPMGIALNGSKLKCYVALPARDDWRAVEQSLAVMRRFQMQMGLWNDEQVLKVLPSSDQAEDANCLVCGDPIHLQIVKCQQCRTPVHLECWNYIGSCSVFGCGSKRYDLAKS